MAKRRTRRYGAFSVTRRPSGSWQARLRVGGTDLSKSFDTKESAEAWLKDSEPGNAVADAFGLPERGEKPECPFAEAAELLPAAWAARGRTADSIRGYRSRLAAMLQDWGPRVIADTKTAALLAWIAAEQKTGRAARMIRQRPVMLSRSMKAAVDAGWIPSVPCPVPLPRIVTKSERTCTPEPQFEKLLKAATRSKNPRYPA